MSTSGKLAAGWSKSRIGDVVEDRIEQGLPEDAREFTYVDISAVDNQLKDIVEPKVLSTSEAPSRARQRIQAGDVLVSTTRPNLNAVALVSPKLDGAIASTGFAVLRPILLEPRWLFSIVQSEDFVTEMSALVKGALYPAIRPGHVHDYVMPVPPLAEQKRITAKLGKLLKRTRSVHEALDTLPELIRQYRAAVLESACTGRLVPTEAELARKERRDFEPASVLLERILVERRAKWEADQLAKMRAAGKEPKDDKWKGDYTEPTGPVAPPESLPKGWAWATLDQLSIIVRGASPRPAGSPKYFGGTVPWITVGELTKDSEIYLTAVKETLTEAGREVSRHIEADTLLLTNSGATLGVPKITRIGGCINDGVAALLDIADPLRRYLYFFLVTQTPALRGIRQGVAQPNLNTHIIKAVLVPLPPRAEQLRIVEDLQNRLSALKRMRDQVAAAVDGAAQLRTSLFHRALSGKLVPQTLDDEAAQVLLERIDAARKSHRKYRKKDATKPMKKTDTPAARHDLLDVLNDHADGLAPDQLMAEAGYAADEIPAFYKALRRVEKEIQEIRPERKVVILKRRQP